VIYRNRLEQILEDLRRSEMIEPVKGGEKYKQFWLMQERVHLIKLDLFLVTPPAQWGVQMVIRTGPAGFSQWAVTQRSKGGGLPDEYWIENGCAWRNFYPVETKEEIDFLNLLGLGWVEPGEREAKWK